jgi:hypothetical protein
MGAAFGWGTLASSSLVIGALVALRFHLSLRTIGLIMGFGAGVLISALSFDLIEEAAAKSSGHGWIAAGVFAGCLVFFGGDRLIDRLGGGERKDATGDQGSGSSLAIVLGTVLDGIPESMVIGLTIFEGGEVGAAYLAAVFISNLPESISSTQRPREGRLAEIPDPVDVGRDRRDQRSCVPRRVRALPELFTRHRRLRPRVRCRCDPHYAREHDDARGVRARRQAGRGRHDAGLRGRVHHPRARMRRNVMSDERLRVSMARQ